LAYDKNPVLTWNESPPTWKSRSWRDLSCPDDPAKSGSEAEAAPGQKSCLN
jgi:hypothetical protein